MIHSDQVEQGRKLLGFLKTRTTAMADGVYRQDVADYTSPEVAAMERDLIRRGPLNLGLSCLLPNAGDYLTHDLGGVPILMVRQSDGSVSGFLNVCRHRGSRVAEAQGEQAKSFSCPYHGWTYGLDGQLVARPDERSFAGVTKAECALRRLPVVERHGMIWYSPTPDATFNLGDHLGRAADDLAAFGLAGYHHYGTRIQRRRLNWKGVIDTFLEAYHIGVLHTKTIHPIIHTNVSTFDEFGLNLRLIFARRTMDRLAELPEADWDLVPHTIMIYVLFPNTVFIMQGDHVETWHVFPAGNGSDESDMRISLYIPEPAATDSARRHWDRNFDLLIRTTDEDFPVGEGMQRGFYAGAQPHIVFGRNEPGLQHFHRSVRRALGLPAAAVTMPAG